MAAVGMGLPPKIFSKNKKTPTDETPSAGYPRRTRSIAMYISLGEVDSIYKYTVYIDYIMYLRINYLNT